MPVRNARPLSMTALAAAAGLVIAGCSSGGNTDAESVTPPGDSSSVSQPSAPSPSSQTSTPSDTDDSDSGSQTSGTDDADSGSNTDGSGTDDSDADADDIVAHPPEKSWQDALDAAEESAHGTLTKLELEHQEGGGLEYKVEFYSSDTKYAVQYDADTLDELSSKSDDLGDDASKKQAKTFDIDTVIDLDEAAQKARSEQDGVITSWKIEGKDSGVVQYEFDILPPGADEDVEVQINAMDGSVITDD